MLPPLPGEPPEPTRLDLARWLVDPDNPLTARVTVNWVWHKYFGRGLVATLEDFGTQGEKPSHPELLDWLATEFVPPEVEPEGAAQTDRHSATYRQSSRARPELVQRDPLQRPAGPAEPAASGGGDRARRRPGGERSADREPSAARAFGRRSRPGICRADLRRQRSLGREHRPGPLSPRHVHLVPADQPLSRC